MSWLSGWAKRIQLDIDSFYVDEDLTDFPVLITLSSGVGRNDADVRNIFSDLHGLEIDYNNWNPDDKHASFSLSNNNLTLTSTATVNKGLRSIYAVSSGKWYWEVTIDVGDTHHQVGIGTENVALNNWIAVHSEGYSYGSNGTKGSNNSYTSYGDVYVAGDVIGTALDLDNGKIWWSKNGVWQDSGVPASGTNPAYSGLSGTFYAMHSTYYSGEAATANFGDIAFSYSVPEGFNSGFYSWVDADNTKKIMITTPDDAPCYTEIESWDWTNERAWLWTKVPTITSGTGTTLYLYYDKTQPDNDHYVGSTGELAAKNVCNSYFVGVWHMSQDPSLGSSCILDSTGNGNHGTPQGSMTSGDLVDGKTGKALEFDGSNDAVLIPDSATMDVGTAFTLDVVFNAASIPDDICVLTHGYTDASGKNSDIAIDGTTEHLYNMTRDQGRISEDSAAISTGTWYHASAPYDGTNWPLYKQGSSVDSDTATIDMDSDSRIYLGVYRNPSTDAYAYWFPGKICEARLSSAARSAAWIKADYYSCFDNLITFGSEELEPIYYFDGFVYEKNTPVSRTVRLYSRSTGSLMATDTSRSSDGYYYVTSTSSGTHFLVAFDDDAGDEYNALILDKVSPKGTVY